MCFNSDKQAQCITTTAPCTGQRAQETIPPRPPLPRSILRKAELQKRFSMYETSEEDLANDEVNHRCTNDFPVVKAAFNVDPN